MTSITYLKKQLEIRKLTTAHQKTIGSTIKHQRKKFKMTLEEGAEGICSVSYLSKVENNMIEPSEKFLSDFIDRFRISDTNPLEAQKLNEIYQSIITSTFENAELNPEILEFNQRSYQGKLIQLIYKIKNMDLTMIKNDHEELSTYIKNFTDQEILLYVLFSSIEFYYKGKHKLAHQFHQELSNIDFDDFKLTALLKYWNLKHAFMMNHHAYVIEEYKDLLDMLIENECFDFAQQLKLAYLEYLSRIDEYSKFKDKVNKLISVDKEIKFFLIAKNLYYHHQYQMALEILERISSEDSLILKIKVLDVLGKERELKYILSTQREFLYTKNENIYLYYQIKFRIIQKDVLDFIKENIILNVDWIDDVETNLFFLEKGLKEYQNKTYYKDGTNFSQFITRKLTMLTKM